MDGSHVSERVRQRGGADKAKFLDEKCVDGFDGKRKAGDAADKLQFGKEHSHQTCWFQSQKGGKFHFSNVLSISGIFRRIERRHKEINLVQPFILVNILS